MKIEELIDKGDRDGVKREIRHSTSLIVVKDENLDVHLSPVVWKNAPVQAGIFDDPSASAPGLTVLEETR